MRFFCRVGPFRSLAARFCIVGACLIKEVARLANVPGGACWLGAVKSRYAAPRSRSVCSKRSKKPDKLKHCVVLDATSMCKRLGYRGTFHENFEGDTTGPTTVWALHLLLHETNMYSAKCEKS